MKTVKFGTVGLGRLGYEHAKNIATSVPGAELTAICDVDEAQLKKVQQEFDVPYTYTDVSEMVKNPELDAIAIVSPTPLHVEHIKIAMEAGKHVFSDKPLGATVEQCLEAEKIIEAHPDQLFMLGFMRRFDPSYMDVKQKIDNGDIGKVILVRCITQDPVSTIEGTLAYAPHSGGQFLDMCVHDIDLVRWFTQSEPKKVWGMGGVFEFELYRELNDGDNCCATMQCENEAMAFMYTGRAAAHGSHVETEIIGTKGTLRVASVPSKNLVEVMSEHGVCRECYQDFLSRWHQAYVNEMTEFTNCVRENRKPEITVYDGTAVNKVANRCKESFETKQLLDVVD